MRVFFYSSIKLKLAVIISQSKFPRGVSRMIYCRIARSILSVMSVNLNLFMKRNMKRNHNGKWHNDERDSALQLCNSKGGTAFSPEISSSFHFPYISSSIRRKQFYHCNSFCHSICYSRATKIKSNPFNICRYLYLNNIISIEVQIVYHFTTLQPNFRSF